MSKSYYRTVLGGLASIAALTGVASAEVEIGAGGGVHVFNKNSELGVADVADATSPSNGVMLGLRAGVLLTKMFGIEGELGVVPTAARGPDYGVTSLAYRAHLVAQFRAEDPEVRLLPFVLLGGGAMSIVSSNNDGFMNDPAKNVTEDTDEMFYVGVGAKHRTGKQWGVRADARLLLVPSSENNPVPEPSTEKLATNFEAMVSVYVVLGGDRPVAPLPAPPPPDPDPDRDGIVGTADSCPTDPEDKDGFQDADGCPEADNDGDGILDGADQCPIDPEDKDAFEDNNGCPDPDNDADGVLDGADKCPTDPEDKDAFEDDNGCPDPDNDGDGILDVTDTCPLEPETKNGFQDNDGCPDTLPNKVKKFSGVVNGINFRLNSATLLPTSFRTLDQAVRVLVEFPDLHVEIQGHTDDLPIRGRTKFADNLELSQARAESVREYFIKKGIDPNRLSAKGFGDSVAVEPIEGLKGGKLRNARAKNRRVEFKLSSPGAP